MLSPVLVLVCAVAVFAVSWLLTARFRSYALQRGMLDIPNQRSSHTQPTPRGGGVVFSLLVLGAALVLVWFLPEAYPLWLALLGGSVVSFVGWVDDRMGLPTLLRFAVHALAAGWAVLWLGGLPELQLGFATLSLGPLGYALAVLGVVWLINLYNFMDGIDGLAAGQAVLVAGTAGALAFLAGQAPLALASWVLAAATAGFLVWNWPKAKVFMGDVGSGFLGFVFAVLALYSENQGGLPLLLWLLLLAPFVVDTTATLLRRILAGERWFEAHRSHAYQRAVQRGYSHLQVTTGMVTIGLVLAGLGFVLWLWPVLLLPGVVAAVLALLWLWRYFTLATPRRQQEADPTA